MRRFRPFEDTPAHDHLGDIFATLDAAAFQRCFVAWAAALTKTPVEVIAIDGKTLRRSYQKKGSREPIHMVSAFAARQRLVMGQIAVAEKFNEIVAIPALLDMMAIKGAIVTIDAMGCQHNITKKILANRPKLRGFCRPGNRVGLPGLDGGGRSPREPVCGGRIFRIMPNFASNVFLGGPKRGFRSTETLTSVNNALADHEPNRPDAKCRCGEDADVKDA